MHATQAIAMDILGIRSIFSEQYLPSTPQEYVGNSVSGYFCRDDGNRLGRPKLRTYGLLSDEGISYLQETQHQAVMGILSNPRGRWDLSLLG